MLLWVDAAELLGDRADPHAFAPGPGSVSAGEAEVLVSQMPWGTLG